MDIEYHCESLNTDCNHIIPAETFAALENWRTEHGDDGLYIVRSDCAEGFKIVQRYGNFCVIEDKRERKVAMDETERARFRQIATDAQVGHWPPHLGLNTDAERIEFLAKNLERVLDAAVWPDDEDELP